MANVFVTVQKRGVITLPPEVRRRYNLDSPGAQVEVIDRDDGVVELRPHLAIPADQAWFWTERWQQMEQEADADIAAGRVTTFDGPNALAEHLDALAGK